MSTPARVLVALSRQMGAGGAYVGQAVSRKLGVRYVDREVLKEAARVLGRDAAEIENLEERVTSVWSRMASVLAWGAPEAAYVPPPMPALYEHDLFDVEAEIIRQFAAREDAVFVGRAATWILRHEPHLISIFLHAPEPVRVERVMSGYQMTDVEEARQLVRRSDRQRSRFLQSLSGSSWLDVSRYHLAVDTGAVGLEETVELVVRLVLARRG